MIDQPSGPVPHLLIGGGKDGILYMVNRDTLGGFDPAANHVVQALNVGQGIFATSAFWNNSLQIAGNAHLKQFTFDSNMGLFGISPARFPDRLPISRFDTIRLFEGRFDERNCLGSRQSYLLHAAGAGMWTGDTPRRDASNAGTELWNSSQAAANRDRAGNAAKFTVPTVANGKVYVGTQGNNTGGLSGSTGVPGELDVYGLLP